VFYFKSEDGLITGVSGPTAASSMVCNSGGNEVDNVVSLLVDVTERSWETCSSIDADPKRWSDARNWTGSVMINGSIWVKCCVVSSTTPPSIDFYNADTHRIEEPMQAID
jgi:hypothetical protein